jgi:hypothetical protein
VTPRQYEDHLTLLPRTGEGEVLHDLAQALRGDGRQRVWSISGMAGSGKTVALEKIAAVRKMRHIPLDLEPVITHFGEDWRGASYYLLTQVVRRLRLSVAPMPSAPSDAVLQDLAGALERALARQNQPTLITLDNADRTALHRHLLHRLEDLFFIRLVDPLPATPVFLVAAARSDALWTLLRPYSRSIHLRPFTEAETIAQLRYPEDMNSREKAARARAVLAITKGLPAANAQVCYGDGPGVKQAEAARAGVWRDWVDPALNTVPPEYARQRLAVLALAQVPADRGFWLDDFAKLARDNPFLREAGYTTSERIFYYNELEALNSYGLVIYDEERGRYLLEPHLVALLADPPPAEMSPEARAAARQAAAKLPGEVTIPDVPPPPPPRPRPPHQPAPPSSGVPELDRVYDQIVADAERDAWDTRGRLFVGRPEALRDMAAGVCRRAPRPVDIIFIQGNAGSGKSALISRFKDLVRVAVKDKPDYPLLVAHDIIDLEIQDGRYRAVYRLDKEDIDDYRPDDPLAGSTEATPVFRYSKHYRLQRSHALMIDTRLSNIRSLIRDALVQVLMEIAATPDADGNYPYEAQVTPGLDAFYWYDTVTAFWGATRQELQALQRGRKALQQLLGTRANGPPDKALTDLQGTWTFLRDYYHKQLVRIDKLIKGLLPIQSPNPMSLDESERARTLRTRKARLEAYQKVLMTEDIQLADRNALQAQLDWVESALAERGAEDSAPSALAPLKEEIRHLRRQLTDTFYLACRRTAEFGKAPEADGGIEIDDEDESGVQERRRRIVLFFDTFDYAARTGLEANQLISEIAAALAGDFCFIIAGRPPIWAERRDRFLADPRHPARLLVNYLPDSLRDQASVLRLEDARYRLIRAEIMNYYRQQKWYQQTADTPFVAMRGATEVRTFNRAALIELLADLVVQEDSLPVLLSLLEWYVGLRRVIETDEEGKPLLPDNFEQAGDSAISKVRLLNNPADLVDPGSWARDTFELTLVQGLVGQAPGRPVGESAIFSDVQLTAILLLAVLDRGLDWERPYETGPDAHGLLHPDAASGTQNRLLTAINAIRHISGQALLTADGEPIADKPSLGGLWQAIRALDGTTVLKTLERGEHTEPGHNPEEGDLNQQVYKLHDYVATLFKRYINWRLHSISAAEDTPEFQIVHRRDLIVEAVLAQVLDEGDDNKWQAEDDPGAARARRARYQRARAAAVHYGFLLAAVRLDHQRKERERARRREALLAIPRGPAVDYPNATADQLAEYKAPELRTLLKKPDLTATEVAAVVSHFLWAKVFTELDRYREYGYTEVLLQEARGFLYSYEDEEVPIMNLTLPLALGARPPAEATDLTEEWDSFAAMRAYFHATHTYYWQHLAADGVHAYAPWAYDEPEWPGIYGLLVAAGGTGPAHWELIEVPPGETSRTPPTGAEEARDFYHRRYAWRLAQPTAPPHFGYTYPYYERAYMAAQTVLAHQRQLSAYDQARWHYEMAVTLINNPTIRTRWTSKGHLDKAEELLDGVKESEYLYQRARVHNRRGFLYRVRTQIEQAVAEYEKALALLAEALEPGGVDPAQARRYRLQQATTWNNLSYPLAIDDNYSQSTQAGEASEKSSRELLQDLAKNLGSIEEEAAVYLQRAQVDSTKGRIAQFHAHYSKVWRYLEDAGKYFEDAIAGFEQFKNIPWAIFARHEYAYNEAQKIYNSNATVTQKIKRLEKQLAAMKKFGSLCEKVRRSETDQHTALVQGWIIDCMTEIVRHHKTGPYTAEDYIKEKLLPAYKEIIDLYKYALAQARDLRDAFRMTGSVLGLVQRLIGQCAEKARVSIYEHETTADPNGTTVRQPLPKETRWRIYEGYIEEVKTIYRSELGPDVRDALLEEIGDQEHYAVIEATAELMLTAYRLDRLYETYLRAELPSGDADLTMEDLPVNVAPLLHQLPEYVADLSRVAPSLIRDDRLIQLLDEQIDLVNKVREESETHQLGDAEDRFDIGNQVRKWKWTLAQRQGSRP